MHLVGCVSHNMMSLIEDVFWVAGKLCAGNK